MLCTISTKNVHTGLESDMEKVHLFSQPISAHTTQKNTLGLVDCDLYAIMPLIPLLKLRVRDQNCWRDWLGEQVFDWLKWPEGGLVPV